MTYDGRVLALTRHFAKLSISPESSDGFASVGTILPREEAALLPGGLFVFPPPHFWPFFTRSRTLDTIRQGTCKRGRADVAQLVEQLIRNQQVIGSSPIVGSINFAPSAMHTSARGSSISFPCSRIEFGT